MRILLIAMALTSVASADPKIDATAAAKLLYANQKPPCDEIECMIASRYAHDAKAKTLALAFYADTGDVAGLGDDEIMDGGYRGKIHLVPQLPVDGYRNHLEWVAGAMKQIDGFFTDQFSDAKPAYRWRALAFRFVRSIKKRTPSAVAGDWTILYNVEGSLLTSLDGVRETLFHELFHLNDEAHGAWSEKALGSDYDAIVKRCGTAPKCLAPFAPNDTMVRGGTYYAFQPNNGAGVREYAAELAVRYYKEHAELARKGKLSRRAFKCGPPENARAWKAIVDEFFAGHDLVPGCD